MAEKYVIRRPYKGQTSFDLTRKFVLFVLKLLYYIFSRIFYLYSTTIYTRYNTVRDIEKLYNAFFSTMISDV
jgi:hypothetical protein